MKTKFLLKIIMAITVAFFFGCSTNNETPCVDDFEGALLEDDNKLVGKWLLTSMISEKKVDLTDDKDNNPINDIYVQYSDCEKDKVYDFNTDRTFTFGLGENNSDCDNKLISKGTWQLVGNKLSFVISCNIFNHVINFNESESEFSFSENYRVTDVNGNTIISKITFTYSMSQ